MIGLGLLLLTTAVSAVPHAEVVRKDFFVAGDPGIRLFVRHVAVDARGRGPEAHVPVLLVHGARVPGVASFDLPVPGGSLAADLARAGHAVYVMDARGYGRSTRMRAMSRPPASEPAIGRSSEIVRDIAAVVDWIRARHHGARPALFGWATGGHWAGYYATLYSDRIGGLVLLNTLYGGTSTHPSLGRGSDLEDPAHPGRFAPGYGNYRLSTGPSLLTAWDRSIPLADKDAWRDPRVAEAYVRAALASDDTSPTRRPPSVRSPSGAIEDSFYLATGRQLWDASLIRVPTLVVRSGNDFWSRAADVETIAAHLVHAPVRTLTIPGATHFVHLDRPERGRDQLMREVLAFLSRQP
jgi:pimeloyl-ACP methyl ester carboxylesterase